MKYAPTFAISMSLNVALVAVAAHLLRKPATETLPSPAITVQNSTDELRVVTNLQSQIIFVTNRFHWRQLESTNHDEFVANLRAVGCPERTIRDIIVADVWQTFAASEHRAPRIPFWSNGPRRVAAQRQHEAGQVQLRSDLAAMLRRLFGLEWSPQLKRDVFAEEQAVCRVVLGEVSEEQFQRASGLIMAAPQAKEDVDWHCRGVFLAEDYTKLMRRRDDLERQLRAVLSPAQFEEFSARAGVIEMMFDSGGLEELKPTPAELRRMSLANSQVRPLGWKFLDLAESQSEEEQVKDKAAFNQRVRQILGEARYTEFELLQDYNYRQVYSFAQDSQLPLQTAHQLYEVRKLALEEVQSLRQDKALDPTTRTQRLAAVMTSVSREVSALLGPRLFGDFVRQSGQWVTNANHL